MILIITVNYNNSKLTNEMVRSIYKDQKNIENIKIVIVDNNSSDKDILEKQNNVDILYLEKNIGYFPALNEGLKSVTVEDFDYVVICNNDLLFEDNFFELLSLNNYENNIYSISPRILDLDNIDQNPSLDKKISRVKVFFYDIYFMNYYFGQFIYRIWQKIKSKKKNDSLNLESRQIFLGYGAIYILTKNFFKKSKLLDTPPFLMGEEAFLAYQIYETGGIEFFDSSLIVHHKDHSSCSKVPAKKMYDYTKESYKIYKNKLLSLPTLK